MEALPCRRHQLGNHRQHHGDEALHIRTAATVQPILIQVGAERILRPGLARYRHHIGMSGQDDAPRARRSKAGKQVRLAPGGVRQNLGMHPDTMQVPAHPFDEVQIGAVADRGETNQGSCDFQRACQHAAAVIRASVCRPLRKGQGKSHGISSKQKSIFEEQQAWAQNEQRACLAKTRRWTTTPPRTPPSPGREPKGYARWRARTRRPRQ